ncbi:MAG: L-aspartate oxidase [Alphaproteobacteria bacterium]|nr:L-aspartate oxidase [Alphaproteobacteria bacterium]
MRYIIRYILVNSPNNSIVIVGAGLAGLFTAIKLAPLNVVIVASKKLGSGTSSQWAQAGIAAAMGKSDSILSHLKDTIDVGGGIVDEKIAELVITNGPSRVNDLIALGVPFDKDTNNELILRKEAAHQHNRIVSVRGDMTGKKIMETLTQIVKKSDHIRVIEGYNATELHQIDGKIQGISIQKENKVELINSNCVVLATGGIGQLYKITTNSKEALGDGVGMAARAGAVLSDMEFVQFHPTAFDIGIDPAPLATEALRGEGALIVNTKDERFIYNSHKDGELAPRDIVARSIFQEQQKGQKVFLDCRGDLGNRMINDFPTVYQLCRNSGINPSEDKIPISPAAHYHMGGILTDENGKTNIEGLYACGENACSGVHGANRLASNSLLEAIVFGDIISKDIKENINKSMAYKEVSIDITKSKSLSRLKLQELRSIMTEFVGVERDQEGLEKAYSRVKDIYTEYTMNGYLNNSLITSLLIIQSALTRKEHRGSHYRKDFPKLNKKLNSRSFITYNDLEL